MTLIAHRAKDVFASTDSSGNKRPTDANEVMQWGQIVEAIAYYGMVARETLSDLEAITPDSGEYPAGKVDADSAPANNGFYIWAGSEWSRTRGFPDTAAVLTNIAGTADAITADLETGVDPAEVQLFILPDPPGTNTTTAPTVTLFEGTVNEVTYNIKAASGSGIAIGAIIEGVGTMFFKISDTEIGQLVSSAAGATLDYQGEWEDDPTTYTRAQFATRSNKLVYLDADSSTGEDPDDGAPWVVVVDFSTVISVGSITLDKLSYTLTGNNADSTGATDVASVLTTLVSNSTHVLVSSGTYLIDTDVTIPQGVVLEFQNGAVFNVGTGVTITWNGGIIAGPYQQIFSGNIVHSAYTRLTNTPYTFALQGSPLILWSSPYWFGAKGDRLTGVDGAVTASDSTFSAAGATFTDADIGKVIAVYGSGVSGANLITTIASVNSGTSVELTDAASTTVSGAQYAFGVDDVEAIYCAVYFGGNTYIPSGKHNMTHDLQLRQSWQRMFGEGGSSVVACDGSADNGATVTIRGIPPSTSSGEPQEYVVGAVLENIHIDGADAANNNGLGLSYARDCKAVNLFFSNIGRKAITVQYHVKGCSFVNPTIYDSNQEDGSTTAAISFEGQPAGLNYINDGGTTTTDDLEGADVYGNSVDGGTVDVMGYGCITMQRAIANRVRLDHAGSTGSTGSHVIFATHAKKNKVSITEAGDTTRRFVYFGANSSDNLVHDSEFGDCLGTNSTGYAIHDEGLRNKVTNCSMDHSNTSTSADRAILIEGDDFTFERLHVRSCDDSTLLGVTGAGFRMLDSELNTAGTRQALITGSGALIRGNRFLGGAATGVQITADNATVINNDIDGDGTNQVYVTTGSDSCRVVGNILTGVAPQVNWQTESELFASGEKHGNLNDVNTSQCMRLGARIDICHGGTPEGVVTAAVGSTCRDTSGGKHYTKETGSGDTGWVVTGTQT